MRSVADFFELHMEEMWAHKHSSATHLALSNFWSKVVAMADLFAVKSYYEVDSVFDTVLLTDEQFETLQQKWEEIKTRKIE